MRRIYRFRRLGKPDLTPPRRPLPSPATTGAFLERIFEMSITQTHADIAIAAARTAADAIGGPEYMTAKNEAGTTKVAPASAARTASDWVAYQKAMRAVTRAPWVLRSDARVPL